MMLSGVTAFYVSALLGGVTLFGVGAFKGALAGQSLIVSGLKFFFIAVSAAAFGYGVGLIVQRLFPGIAIPV
jgi:VIT1/CCC1 family predicted Fe2+/Mn2+ transporter